MTSNMKTVTQKRCENYKVFGKACNSSDVWYIRDFLGYRNI